MGAKRLRADDKSASCFANALFELLALRKLHLLVPLPIAASRGDQIENAAYAKSQGFSSVLRNDDLSGSALANAVAALWSDREARLSAMQTFAVQDSAALIADLLEKVAAADS